MYKSKKWVWFIAVIHGPFTGPQLTIGKCIVLAPVVQFLSIQTASLTSPAEDRRTETEPRLLPPPPPPPSRTLLWLGHKLLHIHVYLEALWRDMTGDHARSVRIEMKGMTVVSDGLVDTALVRLTLAVNLWRG